MFNIVVFVIGFILFYSMFLWLDKRKWKKREQELNAIREKHVVPRKPRTQTAVDGQSYISPESLTTTFRYVGDFKPGVVYKDGDVVFKDMNYYVSIKGRLEMLGEL